MESQINIRHNAMGAQDILNDFLKWQEEQKKTDEAIKQEAASCTFGEAGPSTMSQRGPGTSQALRCQLTAP